jgi:hypothetical protein
MTVVRVAFDTFYSNKYFVFSVPMTISCTQNFIIPFRFSWKSNSANFSLWSEFSKAIQEFPLDIFSFSKSLFSSRDSKQHLLHNSRSKNHLSTAFMPSSSAPPLPRPVTPPSIPPPGAQRVSSKLSYGVVCSSNINRSMEAHVVLGNAGTFGTTFIIVSGIRGSGSRLMDVDDAISSY